MSNRGFVITAVVGAAFALVACGGSTVPTASDNTAPAATNIATPAQPQIIKYSVNAPDVEAKDADGVQHDNFKTTDSTIVKVGVPVTIVVASYDSGQHGMFFPTLGLSKVIDGTKVEGQPLETTFTFTPTKAGDLRWYCPLPCDTEQGSWAMSDSANGPGQDGFMAGTITVQ